MVSLSALTARVVRSWQRNVSFPSSTTKFCGNSSVSRRSCLLILASVFARLCPVLTAFLPALHGVRKRVQNVYPYNVRFHCHHGLLRFGTFV